MSGRLLPDGAYVNGAVLPAGWWQGLDTSQAALINGSTGAHNALVRSAADKWQLSPAAWQPSTVYALGSFVVPSPNPDYLIFKATAVAGTGTSGSVQPNWPTTIGGTAVDNSGPNQITWTCYTTTTISTTEFEALDQNTTQAIDGAEGSTHAPTLQISIGGSGLQVTGPLAVARGGTFTVTAADGIQLSDGDVPQYGPTHQGRTRTIVYPLTGGRPRVAGTWRVRQDAGVQSIAPMMDVSDGKGPLPARWVVPLRCHDQATLSSVTVSFRVGWPHTSLPNVMPGARVVRIGAGGVLQPLTSTAAGADGSGFVYASKLNAASLWTGQQTITIPCDINNVVAIDGETYYLELIEEQWTGGPQYPWSLVMKQPVAVATVLPATFSWGTGLGTIDGVSLTDGMRILVKDLSTDNANGIWIASSSGWTHASDFTNPSDFTQGVIVPVAYGGYANGGTYWQAQTSKTSWAGANSALTSDGITFLARGPDDDETSILTGTELFAHGSIFQTATAVFTGIAQQTFQ